MNHSFLTLRNKTFKPDIVDFQLRKIVSEKWGTAFIIERNDTFWEVKHPTEPGLGTSLWIETSRKLEFRRGYKQFASWVESYIRESLGIYFGAICGDEGIPDRWKPDPTKFPDYKSYFELLHEPMYKMSKLQKIVHNKVKNLAYKFILKQVPKELKK